MRDAMQLSFDSFGERTANEVAAREGERLELTLEKALAHLEAGLRERRPAAIPPSFAGTDRLLEHALLLYAADLDARGIDR